MHLESLHNAAARGDLDKMKDLIARGADITTGDTRGRQALYSAACHGQIDAMELLLAMGADVFAGGYFQTAIFGAIQYGQRESIQWLMAHGVHLDDVMRAFVAILDNDIEMLEYWVKTGLNLNSLAPFGFTPLMYAANYGCIESLRYLLTTDVRISYFDDEVDMTALHYAAQANQPQSVKILLDAGIDVKQGYDNLMEILADANTDVRRMFSDFGIDIPPATQEKYPDDLDWDLESDFQTATPDYSSEDLHTAVRNEHEARVRELLESGADSNYISDNGTPILHTAVISSNTEIIKMLIQHGADINARDKWGDTPLMSAVSFDDNVAVVRLLLEMGADVNAVDNDGETVLHTSRIPEQILTLLLSYGADINIADRWGHSVLESIITQYTPAPLKVLVERGLDLSKCGYLLHMAADADKPEMIKYLLSYGFDINEINNIGQTPLMEAVAHPSALATLLDAGADTDIMDFRGYTALTYALMAHNISGAATLLAYGASENELLPICVAIWEQDIDKLNALLSAGMNVNGILPDGRSLLMYAIETRRPIAAGWFIDNGADITVRTPDNDTALHYACAYKMPQIVSRLIDMAAELNVHGEDGWTPLHCSVMPWSPDILEMLLRAGADANATDNDGATAAHNAVLYSDTRCLDILRSYGADMDMKNNDGTSVNDILQARANNK